MVWWGVSGDEGRDGGGDDIFVCFSRVECLEMGGGVRTESDVERVVWFDGSDHSTRLEKAKGGTARVVVATSTFSAKLEAVGEVFPGSGEDFELFRIRSGGAESVVELAEAAVIVRRHWFEHDQFFVAENRLSEESVGRIGLGQFLPAVSIALKFRHVLDQFLRCTLDIAATLENAHLTFQGGRVGGVALEHRRVRLRRLLEVASRLES